MAENVSLHKQNVYISQDSPQRIDEIFTPSHMCSVCWPLTIDVALQKDSVYTRTI